METVDKQLHRVMFDAPCNFLIICHFVYQLSTEWLKLLLGMEVIYRDLKYWEKWHLSLRTGSEVVPGLKRKSSSEASQAKKKKRKEKEISERSESSMAWGRKQGGKDCRIPFDAGQQWYQIPLSWSDWSLVLISRKIFTYARMLLNYVIVVALSWSIMILQILPPIAGSSRVI